MATCRWPVIAGVVVTACGWLGAISVQGAAADDPVYPRYEKKVVPSAIQVDTVERRAALTTPATKRDVEEGKAVFTLEGLGEARVWKLPEYSIFAIWTTLKQFPVKRRDGTTSYEDWGHVIQAEELLVAGKWQRYFGLVTKHGVAVAPAEEVDLWLKEDRASGVSWQHLPGGLDWGVKSPTHAGAEPDKATQFEVGDPLPVAVCVRNRRGAARNQPTVFYRQADQGGPALRKGVTLSAERAPFDPRTPDAGYPRNENFSPLKPKRAASFVTEEGGRVLETGELLQAFTLDLRDWFDLGEPGHYVFYFDFDGEALKLPGDQVQGASRVLFGVTLGTPPKRMSIAELNKDIPLLGGKDAEERIRKLIQETCKPPAAKPPAGEAVAWSEAVGGLQARIVYIGQGGYTGYVVLVALKNVSDKALVVPAGHPSQPATAGLFELQARSGTGVWQPVKEFGASEHRDAENGAQGIGPVVTLTPGQEAIVYLGGHEGPMTEKASEVKIVLRQAAATAPKEGWRGVLETPAAAARWDDRMLDKLAGRLPFPAVFPAFNPHGFMGGNMSGHESEVQQLEISNRELLGAMRLFEPAGMRQEFERRLPTETSRPMKLLLASVAAGEGSQSAALYLLEAMKETDYPAVLNVHRPLRRLVTVAIAAVVDERPTTVGRTEGTVGRTGLAGGTATAVATTELPGSTATAVGSTSRCSPFCRKAFQGAGRSAPMFSRS
jgi:hypothetical protein